MDRNKYMRDYWKNNPVKYDAHKNKIMYKKNVTRFIKIIEKMEVLVYGYFFRVEQIENGETERIFDGKYNTSKKV